MADDHGHRACGEWPSRRAFLERAGSGAGAWLFGLAAATSARAAGLCDALLLNCIDYRLQDATTAYMDRIGLRNDYDHVALAGAALAAVTDKRPAWGRTFRQHLATALELHRIKRVVVLDHRDCGAYRLFLGEAAVSDPRIEHRTHARVMRALRTRIGRDHPRLKVDLRLMALDGSVETIS